MQICPARAGAKLFRKRQSLGRGHIRRRPPRREADLGDSSDRSRTPSDGRTPRSDFLLDHQHEKVRHREQIGRNISTASSRLWAALSKPIASSRRAALIQRIGIGRGLCQRAVVDRPTRFDRHVQCHRMIDAEFNEGSQIAHIGRCPAQAVEIGNQNSNVSSHDTNWASFFGLPCQLRISGDDLLFQGGRAQHHVVQGRARHDDRRVRIWCLRPFE